MSQSSSRFLAIPLELRLDIYQRVLNRWQPHNLNTLYSIFSVCKQTHAEAIEVSLKETRYFSGLFQLSHWVQQANPVYLEFVKSIDLRCDYRSLSALRDLSQKEQSKGSLQLRSESEWYERHVKLLDAAGEAQQLRSSSPLPSTQPRPKSCNFWPPWKSFWLRERINDKPAAPGTTDQSVSIAQASQIFKLFSGLDRIWLILNTGRSHHESGHRQNLAPEEQLLLDMIVTNCQTLREFTFFTSLIPLSFAGKLSNLRLLRFDGYSLSSPEETTSILSSLKHLNSISLYRYPEIYDADYGIATSMYSSHVSFRPECLAAIQPLVFFEISHMTSRIQSHFLTPAMVAALEKYHSGSLRKLGILDDGKIEGEFVYAILRLVRASLHLVDLRLVLHTKSPLTGLDLHDYLPQNLKEGGGGSASIFLESGERKIKHNPDQFM